MAAMLGYSREALLTMPVFDLVREYDRGWVEARVASRRRGARDVYTCHLAHADGSSVAARIEALPVHGDDGEFAGTVAVVTNIIERERAAAALQASEARYRRLTNEVQAGLLVQGPGAEILLSNARALELLGLTEAQLLGRTSFDPRWNVVHEDGTPFPGVTHPVARAIAERQPVRGVVMGVHRPTTDDRVWLLVDAVPSINDDGSVHEVMCTFTDITAYRRTREALARSEAELAAASDQAQLAYWQMDAATRTFTFNDRFYALYGTTAAREGGYEMQAELYAREFLSADDQGMVTANIGRLLSGDIDELRLEHRFRRRDGEIRDAVVRVNAVRDASGQVIGTRGCNQDVTELKRAEDRLRLSEAMLARTEAVAHVGSWEWDRASGTATWSAEMFSIFGRDPREGVPSSAENQRCYPPEDLARLAVATEAALESGTPYELELRLTRADGQTRTCLARAQAERGPDGVVARLFGSLQDITEQRQADTERDEALHRLQKIAARLPGVVYQFRLNADGSFCFPYASEAIDQIYGVRPEEVVEDASTVFRRLHPDDLDRVSASIYASARDLTPWSCEYRVRFDDGRVRTMLGNANPEREADGAVLWHGFITDITERKLLEARVARQDRLASMGMVAGSLGHEINNPLSYVLYNLECLTQGLPKLADAASRCSGWQGGHEVPGAGCEVIRPEAFIEAIECATEALSGSQRIKDITRRLGAFSLLDHAELGPVDLRDAFESAIDMAQHQIQYRAKLVKQLEPVPLVMATEGRLTQVLLNLLINAAQATEAGDAELHRITARTWAEAGEVFAEVADTGPGIPPENLERIFEPFFTTKPVGSGSGLGLAICRKLVNELGGELSVHSEPGKGGRFVVRLPAQLASAHVAATVPPAAATVPAIRGRLLIVDDELSLPRIMTRLLGKEHDVVVAGSGKEALALLETDRAFDLVLCDLMMPGVSGVDLHRWLAKADPALAHEVVFMTGGAFLPEVADYIARAGNLHLDKPFAAAELKRLVHERVLAARSKRAASTT